MLDINKKTRYNQGRYIPTDKEGTVETPDFARMAKLPAVLRLTGAGPRATTSLKMVCEKMVIGKGQTDLRNICALDEHFLLRLDAGMGKVGQGRGRVGVGRAARALRGYRLLSMWWWSFLSRLTLSSCCPL